MPKPAERAPPWTLYRVPAQLRGMAVVIVYSVRVDVAGEHHLHWWLDADPSEAGDGPVTRLAESVTPLEEAMLGALASADALK